jgi:hypothetical protein
VIDPQRVSIDLACSRTSIASGLALRDRIISNPASICADSGSVAGVQRAPRHA